MTTTTTAFEKMFTSPDGIYTGPSARWIAALDDPEAVLQAFRGLAGMGANPWAFVADYRHAAQFATPSDWAAFGALPEEEILLLLEAMG